MNSADVIGIQTAFRLTDYSIPPDQVTWPRVTLSSRDSVCVLYAENLTSSKGSLGSDANSDFVHNRVQILNIASGKVISRSRTIAESAKLHPAKPIIALKANCHFQVYNFETKHLLSEVEVSADIVFWKWANEETILLVSETAVLQWSVFKERADVELVCQRLPRLGEAEIVNCSVDESQRWYALTGLIDHGGTYTIEGITQVFSADYGLSQCIEAHTVSFVLHRFEDNKYTSIVMCAASRQLDSQYGKLHTIELGPSVLGNAAVRTASVEIKYLDQKLATLPSSGVDFPVTLHADVNHCVMYVLTKFGHLFLAELESATMLISVKICNHITFCSSVNPISTLSVVSKDSQVLKITVDWLRLIHYVRHVLQKVHIADRLQNSRGMENVDLLLA